MASITVHGLDEKVDRRIRDIARKDGTSLNRTLKKLLRQALGISSERVDHRDEFAPLCGRWSPGDLTSFRKTIEGTDRIDPEDWK